MKLTSVKAMVAKVMDGWLAGGRGCDGGSGEG